MENIRQDIDRSYRHRAGGFEKVFGRVAKTFMVAANPFKKFAFKTPCLMHRFINIQAVHILEKEGYRNAADFYRENIRPLNEGATWIDQDFKSTNHFYHYRRHKGLFGFSDALTEVIGYKGKVDKHMDGGNLTRALFYTGVICHLTQDMTVPQHVNNKLLEAHRDYEVWILSKAWDEIDFAVPEGIIRYPRFESYVRENAIIANSVFNAFKDVEDRDERYRAMATRLIGFSQRATAGLLLDFYEAYYSKVDKHIVGTLKNYRESDEHRVISHEELLKAVLEETPLLNDQITVLEKVTSEEAKAKPDDPIKEVGKVMGELMNMSRPDPEEEIHTDEAQRIEKELKEEGKAPDMSLVEKPKERVKDTASVSESETAVKTAEELKDK